MDQTEVKIVYVITKRNNRHYWNRVGVAFVNRDGSLNVKLEAVPVSGNSRSRDYSPRTTWPRPARQRQRHVRRAGRRSTPEAGREHDELRRAGKRAPARISKKASSNVEPGGVAARPPPRPADASSGCTSAIDTADGRPWRSRRPGSCSSCWRWPAWSSLQTLGCAGGARAHRRSRRGRHRLGVARHATGARSRKHPAKLRSAPPAASAPAPAEHADAGAPRTQRGVTPEGRVILNVASAASRRAYPAWATSAPGASSSCARD